MFVLKIGGSLLTHKDRYCTPNHDVLDAYARTLSEHWPTFRGRLVLVVGGGSYGNQVPVRYALTDATEPWQSINVMTMTTKMFEWLTIIADTLRKHGVPGYPFQSSSWITTNDGVPATVSTQPILHALELGLLPVLSGDLVFDAAKSFVIFSSDQIPELLVDSLPIRRVAMLTDVPGIKSGHQPDEIVPLVTGANKRDVLQLTGASTHPDVTGGMRNKLTAALRLAECGVESVICDGTNPQVMMSALVDDPPPGTLIRFDRELDSPEEGGDSR
ncbi:hypothetical protein LOK74_22675 [Brevibacillus humidisoli]|uniref:isopentenyl phosphate kinase n=1 Tax=Brevibacillus humidisoli TaxID=2895522 RepID=UPI001E5D7A99|nr:isopentenyl phosphate kinase [Brevibacillus humidisoli]UFJ40762.1 hypothetical protein LOK74_22675 [Brevibacillus humidisoli]